jgi:hypothetical protein
LCDDDNDLELAAVVGKAFLPNVSSVCGCLQAAFYNGLALAELMLCFDPAGAQESVRAAVAAKPEQFVQAKASSVAATEEMLSAVALLWGLRDS